MTAHRQFEQHLPDLLTDLATAPYPAYIEGAIAVAIATPRRPAWQFPGRWLPVRLTMPAGLRPLATSLRPALLLVLLVLLLVALLVAYVGSRPRLPDPFGPAGNGLIAYSARGGAYLAYPDGSTRLLIDGPGDEVGLTFSLDGTRIAFIRLFENPTREYLWAANADGSSPIQLLEEPLRDPNGLVWSPGGDEIAIGYRIDGIPQIALVRADGSGSRVLALEFPATDPVWRPPDGRELIVRGIVNDRAGLYLVAADGSSVRAIGPRGRGLVDGEFDMLGAAWSPDGSTIAYHTVDPVERPPNDQAPPDTGFPNTIQFRVHLLNADGTDDRVLSQQVEDIQEAWPAWSPDGTLIATQRWREEGNAWLGIVPADGSSAGRDIGSPTRFLPYTGWATTWAPDGSRFLAFWTADVGGYSIDPMTGAYEPIDLPMTDRLAWQRIAPD